MTDVRTDRLTNGPHEFWMATCGIDTWARGSAYARNDTPWTAFTRDRTSLVCTIWVDLIAEVFDPVSQKARRFIVIGGRSSLWRGGAVKRGKEALATLEEARSEGLPIYGFETLPAAHLSTENGRTMKGVYLDRVHLLKEWFGLRGDELKERLQIMKAMEALWKSSDVDALHNGMLYELMPATGSVPGADWQPEAAGKQAAQAQSALPHDDLDGMARRILPVLVAHVYASRDDALTPLTYSQVGERIGKRYRDGLPYSRIGPALTRAMELVDEATAGWPPGDKPPLLSAMVIPATDGPTRPPSDGISASWRGYALLSRTEKLARAEREWRLILEYGDRWNRVLEAVGLDGVPAAEPPSAAGRGGWGKGESPDHKALKNYVLGHPGLFGADATWIGDIEHELLSKETIDVIFMNGIHRIGVEVKSIRSDDHDLQRGVFQVVKYRAVLEAHAVVDEAKPRIEVFLATQRDLPPWLARQAKMLGVPWKVIEPGSLAEPT